MKTQVVVCLLLIGSVATAGAQQQEKQLFGFNAYEPVPSPDGKLIAYVLTGRKLSGGSGGLGRSNLQSDVKFCDMSGHTRPDSGIEGFLGEWLRDSSAVVEYRDWRFGLLTPAWHWKSDSMYPGLHGLALTQKQMGERVAYLSKLQRFVWLEYSDTATVLQSTGGPMAKFKGMPVRDTAVIVPSPDERYIAMGELPPNAVLPPNESLWVYDTTTKTLTNLGSLTIHPDPEWDYIKPSWNPWFADGKHLAFFSGASLYVATPDGKERRKLLQADHGGLAIPSPDGKFVAYTTYSPRQSKYRNDLNFWGGSTLWIVPTGGGPPRQITRSSDDETYDLRWLSEDSLVFDRISEGLFNEHARIWTVSVTSR